MCDDSSNRGSAPEVSESTNGEPVFGRPSVSDGAQMWRIARDSKKLDLNSSYTYLLWARDFGRTSAIATVPGSDGAAVVGGFVIGFLRPEAPDTLLIWQIAVDDVARGKGVAGGLLDHLLERLPEVRYLETTVTPDNAPSLALFESLARRWSATMESTRVFSAEQFPDEHEPEDLYRIGPLRDQSRDR